MTRHKIETLERENKSLRLGMELAGGVIAHAPDWDNQERAEWRKAAERWRDEQWHPIAAAAPGKDNNPKE